MRPITAVVLSLTACLSACEPGELRVIETETPDGFAPGASFEVRHAVDGAREGRQSLDVDSPILDPRNIVAVPSGAPVSELQRILVAEGNGWRVLSYPVQSTAPLQLGAPEVLLSTNRWRAGAVLMPVSAEVGVQSGDFGRILVPIDSGELLVSGPEGGLWVSRGDWETASPLGAGPEGLAPDGGVSVGAADLSGVVGAAFDPGGDGREAAVVMVSHGAVFSMPVAGLTDPTEVLTRVVGSGARGESNTGDLARSAPLSLIENVPIAVDSAGNLILLESDAGRILMIPGYQDTDAIIVRLAGRGRAGLVGDNGADALNLDLEVAVTPRVTLHERPDGLDIDFLQTSGIPWRVAVTYEGGDPDAISVESGFILERVLPEVRGYIVAGGTIIAGRGDFGALGTYRALPLTRVDAEKGLQKRLLMLETLPAQVDPLAETPLAGTFSRERDVIGRDFLPDLVWPGSVLTMPVFGRETLIVSDSGSGHVMLESGGALETFIFRSSGSTFAPFRNLSIIPETDRDGIRLLLGSRTEVISYSIEGELGAPTLIRRGFSGPSLNGLPLGAWRLSEPPNLLGVLSDGSALVIDPDRDVLFSIDTNSPVTATTTMARLMGGPDVDRLPRGRPSGLTVVTLANLASADLSPEGVLTAVLSDKIAGDQVLVAPMEVVKDAAIGGGVFNRAKEGLIIAGGGAGWPGNGADADEVGLRGVTSALTTADGSVWMAVRGNMRTGLWRVDADGALERISETASSPTVDTDEADLAELVVAGSARLSSAPCLPESVVILLGGNSVWALNLGSRAQSNASVGQIGAGRARRIAETGAAKAVCLPAQDRLGLLDAEGTTLVVVETGDVFEIEPEMATTDLLIAPNGQTLSAGPVSDGGALFESSNVGNLRLSGTTPSVFDGRQLLRASIAADLPVFTSGPDGLVYGASAGLVFRFSPFSDRFSQFSAMEVLWSGEPISGAVTALAVEDSGDVLVASRGRLYRLRVNDDRAPTPDDTQVQRGAFELLAGGGDDVPGLGGLAVDARMGPIEGIAPSGRRIVLRWGGYVGYVDADGVLVGLGGGGDRSPFDAEHPWEIALSESVGAHPAVAVTRRGEVITSDPGSGTILSFELP